MLDITNNTLTYTHNYGFDSHVVFTSAVTHFEYNSFFAKANTTYVLDLEHYLYPSINNINIHAFLNNIYTSFPLVTMQINEYCIINDIDHNVDVLQQFIHTLRSKRKIVHLDDCSKRTIPAYRLSKVFELFDTGCTNVLHAYFCADDFFSSADHPKYFCLK